MTPDEYKAALDALSDDELRKFEDDFGVGPHESREQRVRQFLANPQFEGRICHLLGLKTEAEKLTEAALRSATAARRSARMALFAVIAAIIASLIAFIAALVS